MMLSQSQWDALVSKWNWVLEIGKKRNWDVSTLKIGKPEKSKNIEKYISKHNLILPKDFLFIVENFSSCVTFDYFIEGEEPEDVLSGIFSGGSADGLWDFKSTHILNESIKSWQEECFSNPEDDYDKVWYNKTGIQSVPSGDIIAFDIIKDSGFFPVVYLSHDDGTLHGKKLADNFIEFITVWSNIGCPGNEDWQFSPFIENDKLSSTCKNAKKWIDWLEK